MQKLGSLVVVGLVGLAALAGCGSDGTSPSASAVFPTSGFLGRKVRVEIVGDATTFKDGATADFGTGITTDKVTVASPTSLFADITITDAATIGLHDVNVTSGGGKALPLSQAFDVESAISVKIDGNPSQGSISFLTITNHDLENLFDTTNDGNIFGPTFTNLSITAGDGTTINVSDVTPFSVSATLLVDLDGASAPLSVISGVGSDAVMSPLGEDLKINARTATDLVANTPTAGNLATAFDTQLYAFTPAATPALAKLTAITATDNTPRIALLPASGKFADLIVVNATAQDVALQAGAKYYAVVFDNSGASGYGYTIRATSLALTAKAEAANNDTAATAQAITLPAVFTAATLSSITDQDWLTFNAVAADVGKHVHVVTLAGDPQTDTVVDVFSGATAQNSLGESDDSNYHEDFVSDPIAAAGKISIEISASPMFDTSLGTNYIAIVTLE